MMLHSPLVSSVGRRGRLAAAFRLVCCGVTAAAIVAGTASDAGAQGAPSLAEVAKKEQQRRKSVKPAQKVYTNKDLPPPAPAPEPAAPAATPATGPTPIPAEPAPAQPEQQKAAGEQKDEAWWRNRMNAAREELRRNEVFLEALQSRVNALSADFVNRDDPYQRAKIGEERQKALAEMDRVKRELEETNKAIENLEEEARKAGVPPGWLR